MSSPVGHGLVALAVYEAVRCAFVPRGGAGAHAHAPAPRRDDATGPGAALARRWPWLFVLGAVLPDIDSILMPLAGERRVAFLNVAGGVDAHRGLTHTLVFALAAGLFLFACGRSGLPRAPLAFAPALVLAVALHPALDWAMADGAGLPFLWPFSDRRFRSPWPLVPSAYYAVSLADLAELVRSPGTLRGFFLEGGIFLPWYVAARRLREARDGSLAVPASRMARDLALLALLSAASVAATYHLMSRLPG
ncbi:MAG: metal-dependent hydrolase [Planctomycetes bacterium]|nr:metal-dependent hydrolase [Planctomycetota bacterium]